MPAWVSARSTRCELCSPPRLVEIGAHRFGIDDEPVDRARSSARQREIERDGRVGGDDALDRGMGDVALVPQRHVLERGGTTSERTSRASPVRFSDSTGLRLCGIADEPFWPGAKYSSASRTSLRWRWRISSAKRSSELAITAKRREIDGVAVARDDLGRDRLGHEAELLRDMLLDGGIDIGEGADRAGNGAGRDLGLARATSRSRARANSA